MSRHNCPDCRCDDNVLVLPFGFLPIHLNFLSTSEGSWIVDDDNRVDEHWTKVWNDLANKYDRIEFRPL